jgi:hypothetical protein
LVKATDQTPGTGIGIIFAVLCIPSLLKAWTDGRIPRFGGLIALTRAVRIGRAAIRNPAGHDAKGIASTFARVLGGLMN